jgi:hypothetical protein
MGNYVYSNNLIGLTIHEANEYVSDNNVYMSRFNWTLITKIKRTYPSSFSFDTYNPTELNVYVDDNNKISELVRLG